jgi:hypothetical protein
MINSNAILKDIFFKNTPFKRSKKYFNDTKSVTGISHEGIFSTGVANPDIRMYGTTRTKAPKIPCCCVDEIDEIKRPIPTIENKKEIKPIYKITIDPMKGTPKNVVAAKKITLASIVLMIKGGIVFPMIKTAGDNGDTNV